MRTLKILTATLFFFILTATGSANTPLRADLNGDCMVDMADLCILMSEWMQEDEDCMSLGPELVLNGTFEDNEDNWTLEIPWEWNAGAIRINVLSERKYAYQSIGVVAGHLYLVEFTAAITGTPDEVATLGGTSMTIADGANSQTVMCGSDDTTIKFGSVIGMADTLQIDTVSVKEVLGGGVDGSEYLLLGE